MTNGCIEPELMSLIEHKAQNEDPDKTLEYVVEYISQLNKHVSDEITLSSYEIEQKLDYLIGCTTITLDLPLNNLEFLRARKLEGNSFKHLDDLSYIKLPSDKFPQIGRLNSLGQPLFYAALKVRKCDKALDVVLSEADARDLDKFTILLSSQKDGTDITLRILGIWNDVRIGIKPFYMDSTVFQYYLATYEKIVSQFPAKLLKAYQLTDRFLADIISRKGSSRLYEITSVASSIMLSSDNIDGILYSSVKANGEPVVALTPFTVDNKIEHSRATEVFVEKHLGYEFYNYKTEHIGSITPTSGSIVWPHLTNQNKEKLLIMDRLKRLWNALKKSKASNYFISKKS